MRRFFKIVGIFTLFAAALAYFGFRLVFFDPFEGTFTHLDSIVPRDIDFVARRANLHSDFTVFPHPDFYESLQLRREWRDFQSTELYHQLTADLDLEGRIATLEKALRDAEPFRPMDDLLGREVMVVGRFLGGDQVAVALLARGSFRAKAAIEALSIGSLRGLAGDQISSYSEQDGVATLGLAGMDPIHLFRRKDLLVVGNNAALVGEMRKIADEGGINLFDSPHYREIMAQTSASGRALDFALDVPDAAKQWGWQDFLAGQPEDSLAGTLLRFLPPKSLGLLAGRLFLGDRVELTARTVVNDFSALRGQSAGLFSGNSGSLLEAYEFCGRVFPSNVFACGYLRVNISAYLQYLESTLSTDDRELLAEFVRLVRQRNPRIGASTAAELMNLVASYLANEVAIAFEPQAPYTIPGAENVSVPNKRWGPRIALAAPVADKGALSQLVTTLQDTVNSGRERVGTVWRWSFPGGVYPFQEVEFFDQEVPPIAMGFVDLDGREFFVLTVTGQFMQEIVQMRLAHEAGRDQGLGNEVEFKQARAGVQGFGQGFLFCRSSGLRKVLSDYALVVAEEETRPNWEQLRPQVLQEIIQEKYPQYARGGLPEEIRRQLDPVIDSRMEQKELEWRQSTLPAATRTRQANLAVCELFRWAGLTYTVSDRDIGLRLMFTSPASFP